MGVGKSIRTSLLFYCVAEYRTSEPPFKKTLMDVSRLPSTIIIKKPEENQTNKKICSHKFISDTNVKVVKSTDLRND
uniref:Ovule protein n=1 Tax=Strongyloides stercoralis TaxID=6248 RepID=A0A0K0DS57_STRER